MGVAEVVAVLRANTSEFTAKMGEAEAQVTKLTKSGASNFEKLASVGKVATMALGAGALAVGVIAVDLGNKAEDAQAQLVNAFKNAGTSVNNYKPQIAAVDAQLTKYGYTNTETNAAIARLVTVTGNAKTSLNDMGLAANIARNRHIDLTSAGDLLAKTMAGNVTAAKRMGIEIPPEILKIKDPMEKANDITAILEERFRGSAAAAAGTFSGRMETMKAQGENLASTIGVALIPILEKLVTQVSQVVTWFEKHKAIAEAVGAAILTLVGTAIAAYIASMIAAAVATISATWPILLIIAAVALVGVAIFELATHWHEVWTDIKNWIHDAWQWITQHAILIGAAFGPIGLIIAELAKHWHDVWAGIQDVISFAWNDVIKPIINAISSAIGGLIQGFKDVVNAGKSIANVVSNPVGAVGHLLGFAGGGEPPVGRPSIVGENGPELIVPHTASTIIPNGALGGAGGQAVTVPIQFVVDGQVLADVTQTALLRKGRGVPTLGFS